MFWENVGLMLQFASRVVSWLFVKLAWLIIRLIHGKKTADKRF